MSVCYVGTWLRALNFPLKAMDLRRGGKDTGVYQVPFLEILRHSTETEMPGQEPIEIIGNTGEGSSLGGCNGEYRASTPQNSSTDNSMLYVSWSQLQAPGWQGTAPAILSEVLSKSLNYKSKVKTLSSEPREHLRLKG